MYPTQTAARLTIVLFLVGLAAPLAAQDRIPWITDLEQARQLAERQKRLVLLHFWSETCPPCRRLETGVFNRPEFIRALTTGYIPVKINADDQPRLVTFYNIDSVPTDVIVTPEGREIQRFTSKQDPNTYIAMLDGIRARAGVGAYAEVATYAGGPTPPSAGGATPYATQPGSQGSAGNLGQNHFANPLQEGAPSQQSNVSPRYANPYANEQPATHAEGSRWGGQAQSRYDAGAAAAQNPNAGNSQGQPGASPNLQPQENRYAGTSAAPQNGYGSPPGGAQPQVNQYAHNPNAQNSAPSNTRQAATPAHAASHSPAPASHSPAPASQPTIALEGYCPVTLIDNRFWQAGDKRWGAVHEGHVYLFAGQQQQQQFLRNPRLYAPLMAGYDPVRYAETGQLVQGRREFGLYVEDPGPIALFGDEASLQRFEQNAGYYYDVLRQASGQPPQQRR